MASEKKVQNDALVALTREPETMCWRNNTGQAWQGERVRALGNVPVPNGFVLLRNPRPISFGCSGSGDIIGVTHGRGWSIEMKAEAGRLEVSQRNFKAAWELAGGVWRLAKTVEQAVDVPRSILRGE